MLSFPIAPASDAVFAIQAVNDQYNSFWRSVATALFYIRTGINLGYGAPPIRSSRFDSPEEHEGTDILESHPTPNHYVQECLANWLEFYVGAETAGSPVTTEGLPKDVCRGDFSGIFNDGKTFPPLSALLNFLEDWYAGASIRFLQGEMSQYNLRHLDAFMKPFTETLENFLAPAESPRVEEASKALASIQFANVVGYAQRLFARVYPERKVKGRLRSAAPQVLIMEPEASEATPTMRHSAYTAVAQGTSIVAVPPDVSHYKDTCTFVYAGVCTPLWSSDKMTVETVLAPDRLILYRVHSPESTSPSDYGSFSVLFPLVGSAPTFADRGYCQRVTEDVLRDLFPSLEEGNLRTFLSHLYPGKRVEEPAFVGAPSDGVPPVPAPRTPATIHLSEEGAYSGQAKAHLVVPFTDSTWHKMQPDLEIVMEFFSSHHFVLENSTDIYVAERVQGKTGDSFRARLRLYSEDSSPSVFGCEPMSQILQEPLEDLSRDPKFGLFFSTADALSVGLSEDADTQTALARCYVSALGDYALNKVFGDPSIVGEMVKFNEEDHSFQRVHLPEDIGLRCPCASYMLFEPSAWKDLDSEVETLDNASRYTICMHMPAEEVGEDRNIWVVGERDTEAEDGSDLVFSSVRPVMLGSDDSTYCLDEDMGLKGLKVAKDAVDHASSSLHKAVIFNLLHVHLFKFFANAKEREAMRRLLEASQPFRYAEGDVVDRVISDARDVGMAL